MATASKELNRELIIKDGFLKHRLPGLVNRWRHRYVAFRTSNAGRFIFTVYRDKPLSASNEIVEVPIEDYGGLDSTMKVDGEKHVFSIITVGVTECFAADSPEILKEWCSVIQEYLGQELVLNIEIPFKQKQLKSGKAHIRIRNTGFTITSLDSPPKCMGSWLILHIRKFGGSDSFRFETGSKCPSGEFMYQVKAEDVKRIKDVFTDLSHHKPIFQNDRTGRRMTREHRILQQFKTRQQVGPRLSLQHSRPNQSTKPPFQKGESSIDLARPRSNALLTEDDNQYSPLISTTQTVPRIKNSPSASDIHGYYNLADGGLENAKRKANSLSTATSPSNGENNVYYNRDAIELQLRMKANNDADSDSDSDDDFVDINPLRDGAINDTYYNLRDNPMLKKAMAKQCSQPDFPIYENHVPKSKTGSTISLEEHGYTNLEIMNQTEITHMEDESSSSKELEKRDRNSTLVSEPQPPEIESASPSKNSSDSEDSDSSMLRRRTTSIVEHVMISADQNTRSCENLLNADSELWTKEKTDEGNHSDSELLDESSSLRRKSGLPGKSSSSVSTVENHSSLENRTKSPNRINEYDHLKLKENVSSNDESRNLPIQNQEPLQLHRPNMPDKSIIMKSFQSRKPKAHFYEDIDVGEEETQASITSPDPLPTQKEVYKRKVSVLGREHCYESIPVPQKSPSPPSTADTLPLGRNILAITSPTRFSSVKKSNSRPPLPLQQVSLGSSFESYQTTVSQASSVGKSSSKKPVPAPRGARNVVSDGYFQNSSHGEASYVNGSIIKEQIHAAVEKPTLPPKPSKKSDQQPEYSIPFRSALLHQDRSLSDPSKSKPPQIKPQLSFQGQPNYAQIYVKTEPVSSSSKDRSKLSHSTADKRYPPTNYMQIDHFKTEQLQNLIEQRQQEKNLATV